MLRSALLFVLISAIAVAAFWLFPRKIKLLRKHGMNKTNADLIQLAKDGDAEIKKLLNHSRVVLAIALISSVTLVVLRHFSRG